MLNYEHLLKEHQKDLIANQIEKNGQFKAFVLNEIEAREQAERAIHEKRVKELEEKAYSIAINREDIWYENISLSYEWEEFEERYKHEEGKEKSEERRKEEELLNQKREELNRQEFYETEWELKQLLEKEGISKEFVPESREKYFSKGKKEYFLDKAKELLSFALPDGRVHYIDLWLMDISNGIFSDNGALPQFMLNILNNKLEENRSYYQEIHKRVEDIKDNTLKKLDLVGGHKLFFVKEKDGSLTNRLIERYTEDFDENNFELMKKNALIMDIRKLKEIQELFSEYQELFVDDDGKHRAELINLLGEKGYEVELKRQIDLIEDTSAFVAVQDFQRGNHVDFTQNVFIPRYSRFYSEEYQTIENDVDLLAMYNILNDVAELTDTPYVHDFLTDRLPEIIQEKLKELESVSIDTVSDKTFLKQFLRHVEYSMDRQARMEVLPTIEAIRDVYLDVIDESEKKLKTEIKNVGEYREPRYSRQQISWVADTKNFFNSKTNAVKQMDAWFNRVMVNENVSRHELFRVLTAKEKRLKKQLQSMKGNVDEKMIEKITKETIGKPITLSLLLDRLTEFVRFRSLAWGLSSSLTNLLEGQISNAIGAQLYFKDESLFRANAIIQGSFVKNITMEKIATKEAKKASVLATRYNIFHDVISELSYTNNFWKNRKGWQPYEIVRRTEYLNQTPIMIATLLETEIKDVDGNVSNVWDALDENGNLKQEFN